MNNKSIILVLMLLACSSSLLQLQAQEYQEFAPIGAKWWYSSESGSFGTRFLVTAESVKDTLIEGKLCRMLNFKTVHNYYDNIPPDKSFFFYQEGGKIYHYINNDFYLQYNFEYDSWGTGWLFTRFGFDENGEASDTIRGYVPASMFGPMDTLFINEIPHLRYVADYGGIDLIVSFTMNPVIERIGGLSLFGSFYQFPPLELRCYEDDEIGKYQISDFPCDTIFPSATNIPQYSISQTTIYPNPNKQGFHSSFYLQNSPPDITHLELLNLNGQVVYRQEIKGLNTIPIDEKFNILEEGLYILRLTKETIPVAYFKFLIQ